MPRLYSWRFSACALLACVLLIPSALSASPFAPPIVGTVTDTTGAPLADARVLLTELGRTTTTGPDGRFTFRGVRAGTYHLDVHLLGFAPAHAVVHVPVDGPAVEVGIALHRSALAIAGIHVTGAPGGEDPLRVTQSTTQISGRELDRNLRASVAETLAGQPGISVRFAGPGAAAPVIRGFSDERILVLHDGQRVGDLSSTSADHGLSVDPLGASQIEIVRGPASLLHGSSALGGVVNVISDDVPLRAPSAPEGHVAIQGETVNPGGAASASLLLPASSRVALRVQGGGRNVEDVRVGGAQTLENSFFRNLHGVVGAGYAGNDVTGGIAYRAYAFEYGLPFAHGHEEHEEEAEPEPGHEEGEADLRLRGARHEAVARLEATPGSGIVSHVRVDATAQSYRHDEIEGTGEIGTRFRLNTQTAGIVGRTRIAAARGSVGVSGLLRQYRPSGEEALTPNANTRTAGVFLFQEVPVARGDSAADHAPRLQLGARLDAYRVATAAGDERFGPAQSRSFTNASGSVGVNVPFGHEVAVSASIARAFRAPTVEELFSRGEHAALGTYDVGNPDLDAETNLGGELVLRTRSVVRSLQLAAFVNRVGGYIAPQIREGGAEMDTLVYEQSDARLWGVEGQMEAEVARRWVAGAMGDFVRGRFDDGGPLPYMPAARLGGRLRWDDSHRWAGVDVRHALPQRRVSPGELETEGYTLVGVGAGAQLVRGHLVHSLTLRADNLLDELYRDAASRVKAFAPSPGRNLALVYKVIF